MDDFYCDESNNTDLIIEGDNNEWKHIKSNYIDWKVLGLSKGLGYLMEPSQNEKKLNTNERLYGK